MAEGTTIDTLLINVESNASAASGSIQGLVENLKALKSIGAFGRAVNSLSALADSLAKFNGVQNPTGAIAGLATEMEKLKAAGSVKSVANALSIMADSVARFGAIDASAMDATTQAIERIAESMRSFEGLNLKGVSSTINSLGNIGKITDSLSDETLTKFEAVVKRISTALEPLNSKSVTLSQTFLTVNKTAKQASQGIEGIDKAANNNIITVAALTTAWQKIKGAYTKVSQAVGKMIADAVEWDGVSERFARGFGDNAQTAYGWIQRLNEEMGLNVQQFMQYTSIYAQQLEGLGVTSNDAYQMALGYSELTYDIWAGYNDIFASYDDAAQAVQSAISGNTRAVRRAGFSVLMSTLQQTAANHGLEISVSNATEAEKSYLRYLALVDQAQQTKIIGTYAQEMSTAEGVVRTLAQETKSLAQALGSLFLPLLSKAIPIVTAVVNLISDAVHYIASLLGIQIQAISWDASRYTAGVADYADEVEDVADAYGGAASAADKYKRTILGIDEINPLNATNASGGGGGGGGVDTSAIDSGIDWDISKVWDESIFDKVSSKVKEIKGHLEEAKGILVAIPIAALMVGADAIAGSLAKASPILQALGGLATLAVEGVLTFKFTELYVESDNFVYLLLEGLTTIAGGIILWTIGGSNGLAAAFAVSAIAQIIGIKVGIEKGGDLNLEQAFFTVLTGAAAGATFGIQFGPQGAVIGFVVGALLSVAGIAIAVSQAEFEKAVQEDIASRFGTLHYTAEELEVLVNKINYGFNSSVATVNGSRITMAEALNLYSDAEITLQNVKLNVQNANESLETMFSKLAIGVEISGEEFMGYIDDFIQAGQEYLDQHHLTTQIALGVLGMEDSELGFSNELFSSTYGAWYTELGEQLHEVLAEAFVDGEWIPDKLEVAKDIFNEMQSILDMVSDFQFSATIDALQLDLGKDFDSETFTSAIEQAFSAAQTSISSLEGARNQALIQARVQLQMNLDSGMTEEEANKVFEETKAEIQRQFLMRSMEANLGVLEFGVEQLNMRYDEIVSDDTIFNELRGTLSSMISNYGSELVNPGDIEEAMHGMAQVVRGAIEDEIGSKETQESLERMLESLLPAEEEMKTLAAEYQAAGENIPEAIRQGINNTEKLKALTGDLTAINYMIGVALVEDPSFLNTLATVENAYVGFDQAIIDGMLTNVDLIYQEGTNIPIGIKNALTGEVQLLTPTMVNTLAQLGVNLGDGLGSSYLYDFDKATGLINGIYLITEDGILEMELKLPNQMKNVGTDMIDGLEGPIRKGDEVIPHLFEEIGGDSVDAMRDAVDSHSPSKAFEKIGNDILDGLMGPLKSGSTKQNSLMTSFSTLGSEITSSLSDSVDAKTLTSLGVSIVKYIGDGMRSAGIPNFHFDWERALKQIEILGRTYTMNIPWPKLYFYAQGGFPSSGELYMARENGANEFVGRMGNKSAVANNEQIVEAIARGVADAFQPEISLMKEQNSILRDIHRDGGNGGTVTAGGVVNGLSQKNRRDGRAVVVLGV